MKNFDYAAPRSESEVLELLSPEPGRTEILAGGTDLVGLLKKMVVTPERVINIMQVDSMTQIERLPNGGLAIGAAETLDDVLASPLLTDYRGVTDAILGINSMQLQAQGTIGGEICQRPQGWHFRNGYGLLPAAPYAGSDTSLEGIFDNMGPARFVSSSRLAPALIALGASLRVIGPEEDQEQLIPLKDFYRTPRKNFERETILRPNQLVTHIVLPPVAGLLSATYEVRSSAGPDFPLAASAVMLRMEAELVCEARVVLGQVGAHSVDLRGGGPTADRFAHHSSDSGSGR